MSMLTDVARAISTPKMKSRLSQKERVELLVDLASALGWEFFEDPGMEESYFRGIIKGFDVASS